MDEGAVQNVASEFIRQLADAGLWWAALLAAFVVALVVVAFRRGWIVSGPAAPSEAARQSDVGGPRVPDATWGDNVEPNRDLDDRPPG